MLRCNQTHQFNNYKNGFCHERNAALIARLLGKHTHNSLKGTNNTARGGGKGDSDKYLLVSGLVKDTQAFTNL